MTIHDDLARMTVKDLRSLASKHKLPGRTRMKKRELVAGLTTLMTPAPAAASPTPETTGASSPGSSAPRTASPSATQGGPEPGLPIPETYGQDRLVLMAQDPHHLFAYWELTGPARERAAATVGADATAVLVLHTAHGSEQRSVDLVGGNYYLSVAADATYRAQLALRGVDGRLAILAESKQVRTPAAAPSENVDEAWMALDGSFDEMVAQAGLPGGIGSSASLSEQRMRSRLWHALVSAPLGSSEHMPTSRSASGLLAR